MPKRKTENVLAQIDSWLAQCQSDKAHILEATIYLPDMNDYAAMNEAWDAWTAPRARSGPRLRGGETGFARLEG